jgi:hypothetical protein
MKRGHPSRSGRPGEEAVWCADEAFSPAVGGGTFEPMGYNTDSALGLLVQFSHERQPALWAIKETLAIAHLLELVVDVASKVPFGIRAYKEKDSGIADRVIICIQAPVDGPNSRLVKVARGGRGIHVWHDKSEPEEIELNYDPIANLMTLQRPQNQEDALHFIIQRVVQRLTPTRGR